MSVTSERLLSLSEKATEQQHALARLPHPVGYHTPKPSVAANEAGTASLQFFRSDCKARQMEND